MHTASAVAVDNAEIFYSIRLEDRRGAPYAQHAWQTKQEQLSSNHARLCVRALLDNETLKQALDPLLDVPALRQGLMISTMKKLRDARADEEASAYLQRTDAIWMRILGSRQGAAKMTADDVLALELRCPKFCTADAASINAKFEQGTIFAAFSQSERDVVRDNVLSIDTIILSLRTFSQDIHVLEACAASMKHIVTPSKGLSIRQTLLSCFEGSRNRHPEAEQNRLSGEPSPDAGADAAMQELWAFMLGNFPNMCLPRPRTNVKLLAGPLVLGANHETILRAATLADELGFRTPEIRRLVGTPVSKQDGSRQPEDCNAHSTRLPETGAVSEALPMIVGGQSRGRLHKRCGRPRNESYQLDRTLLTRANLCADLTSRMVRGPELTSFFVLRCQYTAFFGSVASSQPSPYPAPIEETASDAPADAVVPGPLSVEQCIRDLRRFSDSSEYTSVTVGEPSDDSWSQPRPAERSAAAEEPREILEQKHPEIIFKEILRDEIREVKRVGADQPDAVRSVAVKLKGEGKSFVAFDLQPLQAEECYEAALKSGVNTVIVLPYKYANVSEDLKTVVGRLPRGETLFRNGDGISSNV